jgi:hypothetical protein
VDLNLAVYQTDRVRGLLGLARTLKTLPTECRDLREFATMAVLIGGQEYGAPLVPPITHDGTLVAEHEVSPDCRTILTKGTDGTVRLWDVRTGRPVAVLRGSAEPVISWGFSPDGRSVYTDDWAGVIRVWNAANGTLRAQTVPRPTRYEVPRAGPFTGGYSRVNFTGDRLLTARKVYKPYYRYGPVELWDATTGKLITRLDSPTDRNTFPPHFEFAGDGRWVVATEGRSTLRICSAEDGRLLTRLTHAPTEHVRGVVAVSPDARWVLTLTYVDPDLYYRVWEADSWRVDPVAIRLRRGWRDFDQAEWAQYVTNDAFVINEKYRGLQVYQHGRAEAQAEFSHDFGRIPAERVGDLARLSSGLVVDIRTWQRLPLPPNRQFQPELARFAPDGRFVPHGFGANSLRYSEKVLDTFTDRLLPSEREPAGYIPGYGFISIDYRKSEGDLRVIRMTPLDVQADLLELWLQVALRGELGPDGSFVPWNEATWERKRQELAARPAPDPDFPFPGHVATDRLHWLRREFEEATDDADKLRLARDLLRRAEAAGDRTEAVRWRAEVAKRTPEVAPPPRAVVR